MFNNFRNPSPHILFTHGNSGSPGVANSVFCYRRTCDICGDDANSGLICVTVQSLQRGADITSSILLPADVTSLSLQNGDSMAMAN
jgi:hypothetical protein